MGSNAKAVVYVLICVALWALIPVVSKLGQTDLDNHQFLFWSSAVSFLAFVLLVCITRQIRAFGTYSFRNWLDAVGLGFLGTYLYYILLYFGYANAQGLEVLVLQYSWPIFIVLLSVFLLRESVTLRKSLSVLFGFAGVFLVLTKGDLSSVHLGNLGVDALVLLGAFTFGLFSVLSKRVHLEPYTMIAIYFLTATGASFVSMLWLSDFAWPTGSALVPILVNGLFVNGYSYIFWIKALKAAQASFVAPFVFLTPVLSALYLIAFFEEPFLPIYGLGLFAVIVGGLLNK